MRGQAKSLASDKGARFERTASPPRETLGGVVLRGLAVRGEGQRIDSPNAGRVYWNDPELTLHPPRRLVAIVRRARAARLPRGKYEATRAIDIPEIHDMSHGRTFGAMKRRRELARRADVHGLIPSTQMQRPDVEPSQPAYHRNGAKRMTLGVCV